MFYIKPSILFITLCVCLPFAMAGQTTTSVRVSCEVTPNAIPPKSPILLNEPNVITLPTNIKSVGDILITCPKNTSVKVTVSQVITPHVHANQKICTDTNEGFQFYRDANCTELWDPNKTFQFTPKDNSSRVIESIYCKSPQKSFQLKPGQIKEIITFTTLY